MHPDPARSDRRASSHLRAADGSGVPEAGPSREALPDSLFRAAFEAFPGAACILEPLETEGEEPRDWCCTAANGAAARLTGGAQVSGASIRERFPRWAERWCAALERVLASGVEEVLTVAGSGPAQVIEIIISPLPETGRDAVIAKLRDVSSERVARQRRIEADTRYASLFNAIDEGFCIVEVLFGEDGRGVDYRFLEANPAFVTHTGLTSAVGKRMLEMQPDIESHWPETYGRIALSGTPERFEQESPAMGRWFDVFAFPIGETAPHRVGILFQDVGRRKEMELALRHSEDRLHSLIKATSDLIFRMAPDGTGMQRVGDHGLLGEAAITASWLAEHVPAEDRAAMRRTFENARAKRAPLVMEHRVNLPDGTIGWLHTRAIPVLGEDGEITEWFGMATDITARRKVEEQLLHGAQMLRVASEIGKVGLWDWNVETGEIVWSDEHFRMTGYEVGAVEPSYELWAERLHPDDRERVERMIAKAMQSGEEYLCEYRVLHIDGEIRWLSSRGRFLYDQAGKPMRMLGAMIDTTERREQEEWHKLLVAELQHRVRNLIGMVRSVARLSASSHRNVDEYVDHLIGRLQAMGRTQGTLTRVPGTQVDLDELVREELLVHAPQEGQCAVEGPDVALAPHAAEIVTLAIHELATNSIKYGALGDRGHIRIVWSTREEDGETWVALRWQETAPKQKARKPRKGFGRRLIEERIPYELRGKGSLTVHDTGVLALLEFPLVEGSSILETRTRKKDRT